MGDGVGERLKTYVVETNGIHEGGEEVGHAAEELEEGDAS